MRPLSALDASFIYLESHRTPMHIGSVYVIDAADAPPGFGYGAFREHVERRLRRSPIFRERLIEVPLNLSHPYWINDPDFELDFHLPHVAVPPPGDKGALMELAAQAFGRPLNRSRPLWEMTFVDGLNRIPGLAPGSFAVINKVHHAAVDGASGTELMGALLDPDPAPAQRDEPDRWQPEPVPSAAGMVARAYGRLGAKSLEFGRFVKEVAGGVGRLYGIQKVDRVRVPPLPLSAPASPLNAAVTAHRTFWGLDMDFGRIRALRAAVPGATVNDVVLSICAGGLRRYLNRRGELPARPLVAMAPVSVRGDEHRGQAGNQVSAMLVNLETLTDDPLQRLSRIRLNTVGSKVYSSALPANRIADFIPSETAALAARLYTRARLGERHRPFFNLVITNVPGPQVPLYFAGAPIKHSIGTAPILDGMGLIVVVFSYAGRLSIGLTSCREIIPDPQQLGADLEAALDDLEAAVASPSAVSSPAAPDDRPASPVARELRAAATALEQTLKRLRGSPR